MALKREIKDAYIEKGAPIYVKTHSNAVYVDDNETETLTQRLDNITWDKFNIYLKTNINKMAINTKIEGNLIKETYFDNTSKITDISDADNIIEKWYDNTGNNILFQRKTTINSDGSISESLI